MDQDLQSTLAAQDRPSHGWHVIGGCVWLVLGMMAMAGSLMSKQIAGTAKPGDPFDFIFVPLLLILAPLALIAHALHQRGSRLQIPVWAILAATILAAALSFAGSAMQTYNYFVGMDEAAAQAFNDVEMSYQKRFNLIHNLDSSARNYEGYEKGVIDDVLRAQKSFAAAATDEQKLAAMREVDSSFRTLVVQAQQYPNLKSDQFVMQLVTAIAGSEGQLLEQKERFNSRVTDYNKGIRPMPYAVLARMFNFQPRTYVDKESSTEIYDARKLLPPAP